MQKRLLLLLLVAMGASAHVGCSRGGSKVTVDQAQAEKKIGDGKRVAAERVATDSYVGSEACIDCHQDRHQSFAKSGHARSLANVDIASETVDQSYEHPASGRAYEVIARDGKLWHRETIIDPGRDASVDPLVIAEYPIRFVIGSGAFAKGYLVSEGDYLLQSPVTWYSGPESFGMSPGYDSPTNAGFARFVSDQCLFCHAGRVTRVDRNPNFFTIHELAIGCERCHGPGRLHANHYRKVAGDGAADSAAPFKDPILHPGKLSRSRAESLCAQCHCQGEAQVNVTGKQDWDFRPGDDFATIKMNYDAVVDDQSTNRFVGHFSQMRQSKCYQQSSTLTCITCHSPHEHADGENRDELHRQQCIACHDDNDACGLPRDDRIKRAENRCVDCHMPRGESEVPHSATTNHRIAVHRDVDGEPNPLDAPRVLAIQDLPPGISAEEAVRLNALGTYWLYRKHVGDPRMAELGPMAGEQLDRIAQGGKGDAAVFASLAMLTYFRIQSVPERPDTRAMIENLWQWAMQYAQQAIDLDPAPSESRAAALEVAGRFYFRYGRNRQAADALRDLTRMRRRKYDWATLGICLAKLGDARGAESALRESIRINGGDPDLYETLAIVIASTNPTEANALRSTAQRIRRARARR